MSESNVYDSIMKEITAGLTGNPSKDVPYLQAKCDEYKDHELGKEIIRACGRLMYDMIPDDKKDELKKVMQKDSLGVESALKEIETNISEKNLERALKNAESLVCKIEAANLYQDDLVSEYHLFNEFFEEVLYGFLYKPTKQLRRAEQIPYTEIYLIYGSLLVEFKRIDEARKALQTGLRWNPIDFSIMAEYIETFKMEGDMDTFFEKTIDSFKIVGEGVDTDAVPCGVLFFDHVLISRGRPCHKEGDLYSITVQSVEQLLCVGPGTVIEGQIDNLAVRVRVVDVYLGKILS